MTVADVQSTKTRRAKIRSVLLNVALAAAVFIAATALQTRNMLPADRQVAPGLDSMTLAGQPYDLGDAAGRPALIYFFAPWCKICGASADNLARLRRWRDAGDFEMVAVALDWGDAKEVRAYAERHDLGLTVLLGDASIARQWQIYAYPSYYVLDSQHRIARRDVGYSSQLGLWWRAWTVQ
jgi:peroxiredoxin